MTGLELYNKSIVLLGYNQSDIDGGNQEELLIRALDIINNICIDLDINPISSLSDEILADKKTLDAICTGTSMLVSLVEGDSNKNVIFANLYNAKRAIALSKIDSVSDILPVDDGGI